MPPVQVRGQVLSNRPMGAYHLISVVAPARTRVRRVNMRASYHQA